MWFYLFNYFIAFIYFAYSYVFDEFFKIFSEDVFVCLFI